MFRHYKIAEQNPTSLLAWFLNVNQTRPGLTPAALFFM